MFGTGTAATITQVGNIRLLDKSSKSSSPSPLSLLSSALCLDCHPNPYHHHHHHQLIWFPNPLAPGSDIQIQIQQLENQTNSKLTRCHQWWLITVVMTSSEHRVHWCFQGFAGRTIGSPAQPLDWPPLFSPSSPISPGEDKQTKRTDKEKLPVQRKSWPPLGHGDWREVGCRGKSCENKTRSRGWSLWPTAQGSQRILIQTSPREDPS